MGCRGECKQYERAGGQTKMYYAINVYCPTCNYWRTRDGAPLRCSCCNYKYRRRPKNHGKKMSEYDAGMMPNYATTCVICGSIVLCPTPNMQVRTKYCGRECYMIAKKQYARRT